MFTLCQDIRMHLLAHLLARLPHPGPNLTQVNSRCVRLACVAGSQVTQWTCCVCFQWPRECTNHAKYVGPFEDSRRVLWNKIQYHCFAHLHILKVSICMTISTLCQIHEIQSQAEVSNLKMAEGRGHSAARSVGYITYTRTNTSANAKTTCANE